MLIQIAGQMFGINEIMQYVCCSALIHNDEKTAKLRNIMEEISGINGP